MTKASKTCAGCPVCIAEAIPPEPRRMPGNTIITRLYPHSVQLRPELRYSFSMRTHCFKVMEGNAPPMVVWMDEVQEHDCSNLFAGGNWCTTADQTQETASAVAPGGCVWLVSYSHFLPDFF